MFKARMKLDQARVRLPLVVLALAGSMPITDAPARAEPWRAASGVMKIGMVTDRPGDRTIVGLPSIVMAYERATGLKVEVMVARDLPALIRAQADGRIDYAIHTAISYAALDRLCDCVEPLAAPVGRLGDVGLRATRAEERRTQESRAPDAPGLHLLAIVEEAERSEAGQHLGWVRVDADGNPVGQGDGEAVRTWRSPILRYGPHVARTDLPPSLKDNLRRFLTIMRDHQPANYELVEKELGGGFVEVSRADYAAAFDALDAALAVDGPPKSAVIAADIGGHARAQIVDLVHGDAVEGGSQAK